MLVLTLLSNRHVVQCPRLLGLLAECSSRAGAEADRCTGAPAATDLMYNFIEFSSKIFRSSGKRGIGGRVCGMLHGEDSPHAGFHSYHM